MLLGGPCALAKPYHPQQLPNVLAVRTCCSCSRDAKAGLLEAGNEPAWRALGLPRELVQGIYFFAFS